MECAVLSHMDSNDDNEKVCGSGVAVLVVVVVVVVVVIVVGRLLLRLMVIWCKLRRMFPIEEIMNDEDK